jgi:hypothetical protein
VTGRAAVKQPEAADVLRTGDNVVINVGAREGTRGVVEWAGIDGSCGCKTVIVRTDFGEWWGRWSEVTRT